jgi:pyrimidine-nucleoside phosphorylase
MQMIATQAGRRSAVLISDMNQPLGHAVGNALEVKEVIAFLRQDKATDPGLYEHCLTAAAHMLVLGNRAADLNAGRTLAQEALGSGKAWEHFHRLIARQGGDIKYIDDPSRLPSARLVETVPAPQSGYLREINARMVGETAVNLGAGRAKKGDPIDHAVGIIIHHKVGDRVEKDEPLVTIHANDEAKLEAAREFLLRAHTWSETSVEPQPLFY